MVLNFHVATSVTMIITISAMIICLRMVGMADFLDNSVEAIVIVGGVLYNACGAISFLQGISS